MTPVTVLSLRFFLHPLVAQFIGVISVCVFSFVLSYAVFRILKETIGLRISKSAERLGTDKAEVGVSAYSIRD